MIFKGFAEGYEYKEIEYQNQVKYTYEQDKEARDYLKERLIATYSIERAEKDRFDRQRLIEKAKELIKKGKSALEVRKGHRKYIKKNTNGEADYEVVLDEERIRQEERFDGYYVVQTSDFKLSIGEIMEAYHTLWKVEESFRIMKSTMKLRPIFHWTPKRIEGHFVVCFIAFLLSRELELRLRNNKKAKGMEISVERIREALNTCEVSELRIEGEPYYLRGKHNELAGMIFGVLKIKQLKNLSSLEEITQWYKELLTF